MSKPLNEMTLAELWELFPIVLQPYNSQWSCWACDEMESLTQLLKPYSPIITHIGSTAINGLMAKPIVDLLIEISKDEDWNRIRQLMESKGYICMSQGDFLMSFNKGYTPQGYAERVYHIHFHPLGERDEIFFRDYLISHPETAKEYETLKKRLLPRFRNDRDGYTAAKTEFIRRIVRIAKGVDHDGVDNVSE